MAKTPNIPSIQQETHIQDRWSRGSGPEMKQATVRMQKMDYLQFKELAERQRYTNGELFSIMLKEYLKNNPEMEDLIKDQ